MKTFFPMHPELQITDKVHINPHIDYVRIRNQSVLKDNRVKIEANVFYLGIVIIQLHVITLYFVQLDAFSHRIPTS